MGYDDWQAGKRLTGIMRRFGYPIDESVLGMAQTSLSSILDYISDLGFGVLSRTEFGPIGDVEYEMEHPDGRSLLVRHSAPLTGEIGGDIELEVELPCFHVESEPYQTIGRYLARAGFDIE